jgi:hypothetical protein
MTKRKPHVTRKQLVDTALSLQGNYTLAKKQLKHEKKASMANKYLEKIAFTHLIGGYAGADKGDKIGGTLLGGMLGGVPGAMVGSTLTHVHPAMGIPGALAGMLAGGVVGGKLYSAAKKALLGDAYHSKQAEIEGTIHGPKHKAEQAKKVLEALETLEKHKKAERMAKLKKAGKLGAAIAGTVGAAGLVGYGAGKLTRKAVRKGHEKKAWTEQCMKAKAIAAAKAAKKSIVKEAGVASSILGGAFKAAKNFGRQAATGATMLPTQLANVRNAAVKRGVFSSATAGAMKPILGNKAVQAGAGIAAGGLLAGHAMSSGQQKQSSLADNKYLRKVAMFGDFGGMMSGAMQSMGKGLSSLMPSASKPPALAQAQNATIGIRG